MIRKTGRTTARLFPTGANSAAWLCRSFGGRLQGGRGWGSRISMSSTSLALGNLRACVILIVLAFHSVLAYLGSNPIDSAPFGSPPFKWTIFPIIDSRRWFGFDLFCAFQNVYLMSFMFFLSGLFVWPSLTRNGGWVFLSRRFLRLCLPAALFALFLMPLTLYATYRVTAARSQRDRVLEPMACTAVLAVWADVVPMAAVRVERCRRCAPRVCTTLRRVAPPIVVISRSSAGAILFRPGDRIRVGLCAAGTRF